MRSSLINTPAGLFLLIFVMCSFLGCDDGSKEDSASLSVIIDLEPTQGNAPFTATFSTRVAGDAVGAGGTTAALEYLWDFGGGQTSTEAEPTFTFDDAGEFTVRVKVTDPNSGLEGTAARTITVASSADLVADDVQFLLPPGSQSIGEGDTLKVSWLTENKADAVLGDWTYIIVLSKDKTFGSGDIEVYRGKHAGDFSVGKAESEEVSFELPAGIDDGDDWTVGVVLDPDRNVGDTKRGNNEAWSIMPLTVRNGATSGPDLRNCGLQVIGLEATDVADEPRGQLGRSIRVEFCARNIGNRPTTRDTPYALYFSSDEIFDESDVRLFDEQLEPLGPVSEETRVVHDISLQAPLTTGTWHLIYVIDPDGLLEEQNEENNTSLWARTITIAMAGSIDGVDLTISDVIFDVAEVFWGQTVAATATVTNLGDEPVERSFFVRFSAKPIGAGNASALLSQSIESIEAGASVDVDVQLPFESLVAEGEYTLLVDVDPENSTDDVFTNNNQFETDGRFVVSGEADVDLAVESIEFSPDAIDVGNTLTVRGVIANLDTDSSGAFEYGVILSSDNIYDPMGDVVIGVGSIENLDGGSRQMVELNADVPMALDQNVPQWYVGIVADPARRLTSEEVDDRANNSLFSDDTLEVSGATGGCTEDNFEPNDASAVSRDVPLGEAVELGSCGDEDWFRVEVPANAVVDVSVSWPGDAGGMALEITDDRGEPLQVGSGYLGRLIGFLEPVDAERTVLVRITGDSTSIQYTLSVNVSPQRDGADLRVRGLQLSPRIIQPGQELGVQFELVNVGLAEAPASRAGVRLSDDGAVMGSALLGQIELPSIEGSASTQVSGTVSIPADQVNATKVALVRVDEANAIEETDEENNIGYSVLRIDSELACPSDEFEPNSSPYEVEGGLSVATDINPGAYADLVSCQGDDDWYRLRLDQGQRLRATIEYTQADGDLEIALYPPDGGEPVVSRGILGRDEVEWPRAQGAGTYFVRVYMVPGMARSNQYGLTVQVDDADACMDDAFEPNAQRDDASLLPDGPHQLRLCPGDEDWFRFPIPAGNIVSWRLDDGGAQMVMTLYDPDGMQLKQGQERIVHEADRNGMHYIQITSEANEEHLYQLRVTGVSGVDLQFDEMSLSRFEVQPGSDVLARGLISNARGDAAQDVDLKYYLSTDMSRSADDIELFATTIPMVGGADSVAVEHRMSMPNNLGDLPGFGADVLPLNAYVIGVVDPGGRQPDFASENNSIPVPISVRAPCIDDDARTNEGPDTATSLNELTAPLNNLAVCPFTEDWYSVEVSRAGMVTVRIDFEADAGDLDLSVLDARTNEELSASRTNGSPETVMVDVDAGTTLWIRVDGFDQASNRYTLTWTLP